jgi:hypothetical protein
MHTTPAARAALLSALADQAYEATPTGLLFPHEGICARGTYVVQTNDEPWEAIPNLIVTEGLAHILSIALGGKAKSAAYFIALFAGTSAPAADWTASNFAATANEIVSQTEGYNAATRLAWTAPSSVAAAAIDNFASPAQAVIATASSLNVTGLALLTHGTRGGTAGELISASKFPAVRSFQNGDEFRIGYRFELTT